MSELADRKEAGARAPRVAVIGGGISGLSAAHRLHRSSQESGRPLELRLFEAGPRLGGVIHSERHEGMLLECGPDSLVAHKPAGERLCRQVGLGDELLRLPSGGPRMQIVRRGRLWHLPEGFVFMAPTRLDTLFSSPLFSWSGRLRIALERHLPGRAPDGDESVRSFVTRRFGREAYERVAEPVLGGLFTADADRLSLGTTMPRFHELERKYGSVTAGLAKAHAGRAGGVSGVLALRDGMEELVHALVRELPASALLVRAEVETIEAAADGGWRVVVRDAPAWSADAVVLACPAWAAARLLRTTDEKLSRELAGLDYASCATVNLVYRAGAGELPANSYGFFVPRDEGTRLLACNFMSLKFPERAPDDRIVLRAFLGGAARAPIDGHTDEELAQVAGRALARLLPLHEAPELVRVHRFPRSMPQFAVGHPARQAQMQQRLARLGGLFLCGTASGAVGLPDCIASGQATADAALDMLASQPAGLQAAG